MDPIGYSECTIRFSRTTYSVSNHIYSEHRNSFSVRTKNRLRSDVDEGIEEGR